MLVKAINIENIRLQLESNTTNLQTELKTEINLLIALIQQNPEVRSFVADIPYQVSLNNEINEIKLTYPLFAIRSNTGKTHYHVAMLLNDDQQGTMSLAIKASRFKITNDKNIKFIGKTSQQPFKFLKLTDITNENFTHVLINEWCAFSDIFYDTKKIKKLAIETFQLSNNGKSIKYLIFTRDYLDGKDGYQLLKDKDGYIDEEKLLKNVLPDDIAKSLLLLFYDLKKIHSNGYVHSDIKLENIFFHQQQACLIDYGLTHKTDINLLQGTVQWLPFEIFTQNNATTSQRTDLYSLALVFLYLIFGEKFINEEDLIPEEDLKNADAKSEKLCIYSPNYKDIEGYLMSNQGSLADIVKLLQSMVLQETDEIPTIDDCIYTLENIRQKAHLKKPNTNTGSFMKIFFACNSIAALYFSPFIFTAALIIAYVTLSLINKYNPKLFQPYTDDNMLNPSLSTSELTKLSTKKQKICQILSRESIFNCINSASEDLPILQTQLLSINNFYLR
ncbi:MAG: hypothetical protein CMF49_05820 [Legionellales bacterium]|nr:hypothetical protein [Legionellales bacterium]|tara:strand:- start:264 stop:1775 length:1512 start_codon:yes stop_codon:yes gene_type:complete